MSTCILTTPDQLSEDAGLLARFYAAQARSYLAEVYGEEFVALHPELALPFMGAHMQAAARIQQTWVTHPPDKQHAPAPIETALDGLGDAIKEAARILGEGLRDAAAILEIG